MPKEDGRYFCAECMNEIDAEEFYEFGGICEDCDERRELMEEG